MSTSIPIPLTTLFANLVLSVPGTPIPTGLTDMVLAINRNVGTNSLDSEPTATFTLTAEISLDGGATWDGLISGTFVGGVFRDLKGNILEVSALETSLYGDPQSTLRQIRGSFANGPVAVSISGSLTVS